MGCVQKSDMGMTKKWHKSTQRFKQDIYPKCYSPVLCTQGVYGETEDMYEFRTMRSFIKYMKKHFLEHLP